MTEHQLADYDQQLKVIAMAREKLQAMETNKIKEQ